MIHIQSDDLQGIPVVYLSGEFEPGDTENFKRYIFDLADQLSNNRMIVDLANLDRPGSGVLRILVLVQRKLQLLDGQLVVTGASGCVREFLDLTGVDKLLDTGPCAAAAASRLEARTA